MCTRTWINALAVRGGVGVNALVRSLCVYAFVHSFVSVWLCVRTWMKMLLQQGPHCVCTRGWKCSCSKGRIVCAHVDKCSCSRGRCLCLCVCALVCVCVFVCAHVDENALAVAHVDENALAVRAAVCVRARG